MKRYTETTKWKDTWFSDLDAETKLAYLYLLDTCDHAGILELSFKHLVFDTGYSKTEKELYDALKGRITFKGNKCLIIKFTDYQYKDFATSKTPAIVSARNLFIKSGFEYPAENNVINQYPDTFMQPLDNPYVSLSKPLDNPLVSIKDKDKDKDKVKDMDMDMDKDKVMVKDIDKEEVKVMVKEQVKEVVKAMDVIKEQDKEVVINKSMAEEMLSGYAIKQRYTDTDVLKDKETERQREIAYVDELFKDCI